MGSKVYINGTGNISAQPEGAPFEKEFVSFEENIIQARDLNYKEFIKPMMLRRMSKAIKMAIASGEIALRDAGIEQPDAIITGTGEGCKQDTENFLDKLLEQDEELLTPTAFIQSTHNTIGGQMALDLKCTGYNMTFTQNSCSLESALLDSMLQLHENDSKNILVGGVEEIAEKITAFGFLDAQIKEENIRSTELLKSTTPGSIISEGAQFFAISSLKTDSSYCELRDVKIINSMPEQKLPEKVNSFLDKNGLEPEHIDAVFLGRNGDGRFDRYYDILQNRIFGESSQLAFKHLSGEYNTASGFAVALACKIFNNNHIPGILKMNDKQPGTIRNILIYNQYLGRNHSLILLSAV